jgi:hypothetical protein
VILISKQGEKDSNKQYKIHRKKITQLDNWILS